MVIVQFLSLIAQFHKILLIIRYIDNLPMLSWWIEGKASSCFILLLSSEGKSALIFGAGMAFGIVTNTISAKHKAGFILDGVFLNTIGSTIKNIQYYLMITYEWFTNPILWQSWA